MIRNAVLALLTLATVGTLSTGILSYRTDDLVRLPDNYEASVATPGTEAWAFYIGKGTITITRKHFGRDCHASPDCPTHKLDWHVQKKWLVFRRSWFCHDSGVCVGWPRESNHAVHFPFWAPTVVFGAYPAVALVRNPARRRHRRMQRNQCLTCGYDLTGNVSGVCPECGARTRDKTAA